MTSEGVIPSEAVLQAQRGISRESAVSQGRSLGPLVKARAFGMTVAADKNSIEAQNQRLRLTLQTF